MPADVNGQSSEGSRFRDSSDATHGYFRFVGTLQSVGGKLRLSLPRGIVVFPDPTGEVGLLLQRFDGFRTIDEALGKGAHHASEIEIISDAIRCGALIPTENLALNSHLYGSNPMPFSSSTSAASVIEMSVARNALASIPAAARDDDLDHLFARRQSCRSFTDVSLSWNEMAELIDSSMSPSIGAAPSAGGLYPIVPFAITRTGAGWRAARWDHQQRAFRPIDGDIQPQYLQYALDSQQIVHGAGSLLILTAQFEIMNAKYSNRGYRFALLEAGHLAEAFMLRAVNDGFSTCEWGAFLDEPLRRMLEIENKSEWPLTVIGVGHNSTIQTEEQKLDLLHQRLFQAVEQTEEIHWVTRRHPHLPSGNPSMLVLSHLRYLQPGAYDEQRHASGVGRTTKLADIRAMAEAFERTASVQWRADRHCDVEDLPFPAYVPRPLLSAAHALRQTSTVGLGAIDWIDGVDRDRQPVCVPAALVFYGEGPVIKRSPYFRQPTSSGVAAHESVDEAEQNALLELVERDAFVRSWTGEHKPSEWPMTAWPSWFAAEIVAWTELGVTVQVSVLRYDIPTVLVSIHSGEWPALSVGASANPNPESALEKAWFEASAGWLVNRTLDRETVPNRTAIDKPTDHAHFYCEPDNTNLIRTFFEHSPANPPEHAGIDSIERVSDTSGIAYVDISRADSPLHVVRALSRSLLPLEFGSNSFPVGSSTMRWSPNENPHPFP